MSKKIIFLLSIPALAIVLVGVALFFQKSEGGDNLSTIKETIVNKISSVKEGTYENESGFSFKYENNFKVTEKDIVDDSIYADLSVSSAKGAINLLIKDTAYTSVDTFLSKDKTAPKGLTLSGAVDLGGISAKQYEGENALFTLAVDQGVVYVIEAKKDGAEVEKNYNLIVDSFAFAAPEAASASSGSDNTIYEEEEIVE